MRASGRVDERSRPLFRACAGTVAGAVENKQQQVDEDNNVDGEQAGADPGEAAEDFEDLKRQERGGDREGEEFAPGFLEIEADAFSEGNAGIGEGEEADAAQEGIVEERSFLEDEVDQMRLGIEAQMVGEEFDLVGDVFVEQAVSAETDGDKEQRMKEFIEGNEEQPAVVALVRA